MHVSILGTEYSINVKKYEEDRLFEDTGFGGYCDSEMREIVVCDFNTHPAFIGYSQEACDRVQRKCIRHEIVHAFFAESGLDTNSNENCGPWAVNEEMIDWITIQGPKIYHAWDEAGALEEAV